MKAQKKYAEPTGSDITSSKASKGPDISSASNLSIPQKADLSIDSAKKFPRVKPQENSP